MTGTQIQGLLVLNYTWYEFHRWHGTLFVIATLLFAVLFNTFFAQQLHLVEGGVLVIHIFGFLGKITKGQETSPLKYFTLFGETY